MAHIQIPAVDPIIEYAVGGTAMSVFAVPFPFFDDEDLVVTSGSTVLQLASHYTVDGAGETSGGTVTLLTAVTNTTVTIERDIEIKRVTDFPASGPLDINGINTEEDRQIAIMQDLAQQIAAARAEVAAALALLGDVTDETSVTTQFSSRAAAALATVSALTEFIRTAGYTTSGDGGGALYKRVVAQPSHEGKFQTADGTWFEIAERDINILMFGAPCNHTDDDATYIQRAIDYLDAKFAGGKISLPNLVAIGTVVNVKDRIQIVGTSWGNTNIKVLSTTGNVLNVAGGNCQFRDFKFTTAVKRTSGALINVPAAGSGVLISGVRSECGIPVGASPCFWVGVKIDAAAPATIENCNFSNCNDAGISIFGAADFITVASTNVQWQGALGSGGRCALEFLGQGDARVWNCQFLGTQSGILLLGNPSGNVLFNDFYNCTVDHCEVGCAIATTANGVVQTRFTNVQFTSSTAQGCAVLNAGGVVNGLSFINCTFQYNGSDGLSLGDTGITNVLVQGGEFSDNDGSGINIATGVDHFRIIGARFGDIGGAPGNGVNGITIAAGCENFVVALNDFASTTGGTIVNGSGTSATKVVANNIS